MRDRSQKEREMFGGMGFYSVPVGIRTLDPYLLYLWGFEDAGLNDEHAGIYVLYFHKY